MLKFKILPLSVPMYYASGVFPILRSRAAALAIGHILIQTVNECSTNKMIP